MTEIRIMGPRSVGKTTYLATLAAFPHKHRFPGWKIEAKTPLTQELVTAAENIIKQGGKLEPTDESNEYQLDITIPATKGRPATQVELFAIDYKGEIFEDLALPYKWDTVKGYVEDFLTAQGWMVMVTDWDIQEDKRIYKPAFEKLCEQMTAQAKISPAAINNLRIAVVMAKCERGELWPGRLESGEDLFKVRLPATYRFLTETEKFKSKKLQFFACSSFGVLGRRNPRPNRKYSGLGPGDSDAASLRKPDVWNPYGILAPIYWLDSGRFLDDEL